MSLDPSGMSQAKSISWNYSDPNREGYCDNFYGTLLAIQEAQAYHFNRDPNAPRQPKFWPDGNPVMNIRMLFALPDGQLRSWTIQRAGKNAVEAYKRQGKQCLHMKLFDLSGGTGISNLIGKTLHISTQPGSYGANNPRPFDIQLVENPTPYQAAVKIPEEYKLDRVLAKEAVSGGQMNYQPQQQFGAPPMQGQYYAAPQPIYAQPQQPQAYNPVTQQYVDNPIYQPPQIAAGINPQVPQYQQQAQPVQVPIPQGMDPAIAAAMQQMGATNIQPVATTPYDDDMPF